MIILGMAQEDEVVNGDDAANARLLESCGQFAGKTVIEFYAVGLELLYDSLLAPTGCHAELPAEGKWTGRIDKANVVSWLYLPAKLRVAFVWGIEQQLVVGVKGCKGIDKRTAIAAKTSVVPYDSFCIKAYLHSSFLSLDIRTYS
jgi:hypothetical protein